MVFKMRPFKEYEAPIPPAVFKENEKPVNEKSNNYKR